MFVYESRLDLDKNVNSQLAYNAQFLAFSPDKNNLTVCNLSNRNEVLNYYLYYYSIKIYNFFFI